MIPVMLGKEEYFIRGDKNQWSIGKMKTVKGETYFNPEWYYVSTEGMICSLLDKKVRTMEATTLGELQENIKRAKDELAGLYEVNFVAPVT